MPKSNQSTGDFIWHKNLCKKCDICQKMCPRQGLKLVDGILTRDQTKCNLCGICALYCPDNAIEISKNERKITNKTWIFDYDGVLVDSLAPAMSVLRELAARYPIKKIDSKEDFLALFQGNIFEALFINQPTSEQVKNLFLDTQKLLLEHIKEVRVFPGIKEMLTKLNKTDKLYIVTSNLSGYVRQVMEYYKINCFREIFGAEAGASKVDKINRIKSSEGGSEIYYVGDTAGDIQEARKAEVKSVAVTWGYHDEKRLKDQNPDYLIRQPQDVFYII